MGNKYMLYRNGKPVIVVTLYVTFGILMVKIFSYSKEREFKQFTTLIFASTRGHERSLKISQCSQNWASARNARKKVLGAGLLVVTYFNKCSHARFLVEVGFCKVLDARKANFCHCMCSQRKMLCSHARKDHLIPLLPKQCDTGKTKLYCLQDQEDEKSQNYVKSC